MTIKQIREVITASPFLEFSLRMADGTVYEVPHPDFLSIPPVEHPRVVLYYERINGSAEDCRQRWLEPGLIAELIVEPTKIPPLGN